MRLQSGPHDARDLNGYVVGCARRSPFIQSTRHADGGESAIETTAAIETTPDAALKDRQGCKFANRCPYVMSECREAPPPLYLTEDDRAVACYLHSDSPSVTGREMAESLAR